MSSTVTVSVRSVLVALGLVGAVVVAYVLGSSGQGSTAQAAAAPATAQTEKRLITMSGTGDATGVPDELAFSFSVGGSASDVSTALDQANQRMTAATRTLRTNGVQRKDIETTGLSIHPTYAWIDHRSVLTGYRVKQSASVVVRSLRDAGKALGAAVTAGGNSSRVSGLNLRIGDRGALMAQARDRAVAEATTKARQYAEATGQHLGDVITLREVQAPPAQSPDYAFRAPSTDALAQAAVPIQAGSEKVGVQVSVVWALTG
jgi:uncharacterized protein YggE